MVSGVNKRGREVKKKLHPHLLRGRARWVWMSRGMKAEPPPPPPPTLAWKAYVVGKANHLQIGVKAAFPCARRFFQVSLSLKLSPVAAAIPEPKPSITHKLLSKSKMVRRIIGNGSPPIFARIKWALPLLGPGLGGGGVAMVVVAAQRQLVACGIGIIGSGRNVKTWEM